MRHLATIAAAAGAVVLTACSTGSTTAATSTGGTTSNPVARSCRARMQAWQSGPAKAAGKQLIAQFSDLMAAATTDEISRIDVPLANAGNAATALQEHPIPHCADPRGYWAEILARFKTAAGNASTGRGLSGLMLAMAPLKEVPALLDSLGAELKRTTGISTVFG